jgi:hypothetical protein
MKRSPLKRHSPLKQGDGLRRNGPLARRARLRTAKKVSEPNPLRDEFKTVRDGICRVCGAVGQVRRHHIVLEQHVRLLDGDEWDTRNGLWVGAFDYVCLCHRRHHNAVERIPFGLLPHPAVEFAIELFGRDRALAYFDRYYAPARAQEAAQS